MSQLQEQKLKLTLDTSSAPSPSLTHSNTMGALRSKKRKNKKSSQSSHIIRLKEHSIPRKLGPRDIGRIKYKDGTKYKEQQNNGTFLDEKIHRHARETSFLSRKIKNPVQKKETVQQTGTPNDWEKPQYYKSEVQKMYNYHNEKRQGWGGNMQFLNEKPSKPKDSRLEALKDTKIPKGKPIREYGAPNSWKPIEYTYNNTGGGFLDEKFWFEGSHVQMDGGLSRLIEALTPQQKLKLSKLAAPTGYQTKINFLKMLRDLVMIEIKRIDKEDKVLKNMESQTFIDKISNEIENEYEKELDESLDGILENYENDNHNHNMDEEMKKNIDSDVIHQDVIYDSENENNHISNEGKYNNLLRRKTSDMGMLQRQLLTMKSVNKLTNLIDDMEKQQTE